MAEDKTDDERRGEAKAEGPGAERQIKPSTEMRPRFINTVGVRGGLLPSIRAAIIRRMSVVMRLMKRRK